MAMDALIDYLQNIQKDLVGIILPVLITAFVSLITVTINAAIQILLQNQNFNNEQYKIMQQFYHKFKLQLLDFKLVIQEINNQNNHNDSLKLIDYIDKYTQFKYDETEFRRNHDNEIQTIDQFIMVMDKYSGKIANIHNCLFTCTIPRPPIMHFILKGKVNKMLIVLQYYSLLWNEYNKNAISMSIFQNEIKNFKNKWNVDLDEKQINQYILLLDKWFGKY